ncbi:MAG: hypothetical protein PHQ19_06025 [Candidatus Krumholzibacteria bacterium]|nr:hypothetical protein [Candidatus Krumholzibacteria bacterium]
MCRETLEELMEFVRHYYRALESSRVDDRFERLMRAVPTAFPDSPGPAHGTEGIELIYRPFREPFGEQARWAAATEPPSRAPLRFCSADDRYVLRERSDPAARRPSFCLFAEEGVRIDGVELVIDGVRCVTGPLGMLDTEKAGLVLTRDSRITLRTNRPA